MKFKLYEIHNKKGDYYLDAEIDEKGGLMLMGQDIGKSVASVWGDSDLEYNYYLNPEETAKFTKILQEKHGDLPLKDILTTHYCDLGACEALRKIAEEHGFEFGFCSYV